MNDKETSDKSRFFEEFEEVEIVRNGKRMRWDTNKESFVEINTDIKAKERGKRKK